MVTKSKLKMALMAEKGVDIKKLKQKKMVKKARRGKAQGQMEKTGDEWEDIGDEEEKGGHQSDSEVDSDGSEAGGVELDGDEGPVPVRF